MQALMCNGMETVSLQSLYEMGPLACWTGACLIPRVSRPANMAKICATARCAPDVHCIGL